MAVPWLGSWYVTERHKHPASDTLIEKARFPCTGMRMAKLEIKTIAVRVRDNLTFSFLISFATRR